MDELQSYKYDKQLYLEMRQNDDRLDIEIEKILSQLKLKKMLGKKDTLLSFKLNELYKLKENQITNLTNLTNKLNEVERRIESLDQPYKNILYMKYVNELKMDEIADKLNYSIKRIYQLKDIAVKKFFESKKISND